MINVLTHKRNFVSEIVPLGFIQASLCTVGGGGGGSRKNYR